MNKVSPTLKGGDADAPQSLVMDRVESLTEPNFDAARVVAAEFFGSTNKRCCCICPMSWCPSSKKDFEKVFIKKGSDRCTTYGLAIRSDGQVIGVVNLRQGGQMKGFDECLHNPKPNEIYVEYIAVTKGSRGMGVGAKLMEWAEAKAKDRGAEKMTLGVVKGNPAKGLYERLGFEYDKENNSFCANCWTCVAIGMPHGKFGIEMMVKSLV